MKRLKKFTALRRIEFVDTDMGGIVHFSRFFVFMETAEHQFRDALGSSVVQHADGTHIGWPRVAATCQYKSPARFGDELEIEVVVTRLGKKSLTYGFTFRCGDRELATGEMTSVCCELDGPQGVRSIPVPDALVERIEVS